MKNPKQERRPTIKKKTLTAGLILLGIIAAFFVVRPNPQAPSAQVPGLVVDGTYYTVSSYLTKEEDLPQGFVSGGSYNINGSNLEYFVNRQNTLWVYVLQEVYNSQTQQTTMKYVRYVDSRIRGRDYISCGGSLYVSLWSAEGNLTQEEQDRVKDLYGMRVEGMPPAEFEYVGRAEFSGYDTIPQGPLASNTDRQEVYLHSTDDTILLASITWNTAPHKGEEGRHTGFNVYVKCENPIE